MKKLMFLLTLFAFILAANTVKAENRLYLTVNGISRHYNVDRDVFGDLNERNWGGGIEYEFSDVNDNRILFFTAGRYKNSIWRQSNYGGVGAKLRFHLFKDPDVNLDTGFVFLAVSGYYGPGVTPALLPIISLGNKYLAISALFIPALTDVTPATLGLQLKFKVIEW